MDGRVPWTGHHAHGPGIQRAGRLPARRAGPAIENLAAPPKTCPTSLVESIFSWGLSPQTPRSAHHLRGDLAHLSRFSFGDSPHGGWRCFEYVEDPPKVAHVIGWRKPRIGNQVTRAIHPDRPDAECRRASGVGSRPRDVQQFVPRNAQRTESPGVDRRMGFKLAS